MGIRHDRDQHARCKAGVGKRQLLSVSLDPPDHHTCVGNAPPSVRQQFWRDVQTDHLGTELRGKDCDVTAGSRTHVEQSEPWLDPNSVDDQPADRGEQPRETIPITRPCLNPETV